MRLTKKSKYAGGGDHSGDIALSGRGLLGMAEIARRLSLPERFLEQIFGQLRRCGILKSRRGPHGEYCLAIPAEEVTVLDFAEIPEGEVRPARHSEGGGHYTDDAPPRSMVEVWDEAPIAPEGASNRYSIVRLAERGSAGAQEHGSAGAREPRRARRPRSAGNARPIPALPLLRSASSGDYGTGVSREGEQDAGDG